jgi:hypothetical protein
MGKTQSKAVEKRHGRGTAWERQGNGMGTAWERHGMCESALTVTTLCGSFIIIVIINSYILTYLLTYLLHGTGPFLKS